MDVNKQRKREKLLHILLNMNDDVWEKIENLLPDSLPQDDTATTNDSDDNLAQQIEEKITTPKHSHAKNKNKRKTKSKASVPGELDYNTLMQIDTPRCSKFTADDVLRTPRLSESSSSPVTSDEEINSWQTAKNKKRKHPSSSCNKTPKKKPAIQNTPPNTSARPKHHIDPLVIEGLPEEMKTNTVKLKQSFRGLNIHKIVRTRNDVMLIFPNDLETKTALLNKNFIKNTTVRPTKAKQAITNLFVVAERVHPAITEDEIQQDTGLEVKRMHNGSTGNPIWKIKLKCPDQETKTDLLKNGLTIGYHKHKVTNYEPKNVQQCFKCQKFGHTTHNCPNSDTCRKCSENHPAKSCKTDEPKCPNCQGPHPSTFKGCPKYKEEIKKVQLKQLTYAQALAPPTEPTLALRLATCLTSVITATLIQALGSDAITELDIAAIVSKSVSSSFKTAINTDQIMHLKSKA